MANLVVLVSLFLTAILRVADAQAVFAHVIVGNNANYAVSDWQNDISLAASKGIDAFALNIATPLAGSTASQISNAFQAANNAGGGFKLFFSFDYLGGQGAWATSDIVNLLNQYGGNGAHYQYNNKPFVSTFEGPTNSDVTQWSTIRSSISGGIYFVPCWTSQGPGYMTNLYDGAFSWDMWANGPVNKTTAADQAWVNNLKPKGKSFMMGVAPWFFTDLPAYNKAWVWRGDSLWADRWRETTTLLPQFVEIVSWNDFGESHYIGPIVEASIPSNPNGGNAQPYVNGYPHQAWLETLPYQIAAYKHAYNPSANPAPSVAKGQQKIVYWYRTSPASAGTTDCTGNCAKSSINTGGYQMAYPITQILEDGIFAIALLGTKGQSVSITVGSNTPQVFKNLNAGLNYFSRPFNGQTGVVSVKSSSGIHGSGVAITSQPASGQANFNAWVGLATP